MDSVVVLRKADGSEYRGRDDGRGMIDFSVLIEPGDTVTFFKTDGETAIVRWAITEGVPPSDQGIEGAIPLPPKRA